MSRNGGWIALGALLLGTLIVGLSGLFAQRPPFGMPGFPGGPAGRYQTVRADRTEIVILDTVTGDLYLATQDDLKPLRQRPRMPDREGFKDRPPFDKKDFEKRDFDKDFKGKDFEKKDEPKE